MDLLAPWWLLLSPLAIAVVLWAAWRSTHPMGPARRRASMLLRSLLLLVVGLILAQPLLRHGVSERALAVVIDGSDSMGEAGIERAWAAARAATADYSGPLAVIIAGADARVLRELRREPLGELPEDISIDGSGSDLAAGLRLAAAVLPPRAQRRLLLISDGQENRGQAGDAVRELRHRGVHVDALAVSGDALPDARVVALRSSHQRLHQGATLRLEAELASSIDAAGVLRLFENGIEIERQGVVLRAGEEHLVSFQRHPEEQGTQRYRLLLEGVEGDSVASNNQALAVVDVRGPPRVLRLVAELGDSDHLSQALHSEGLQLETRPVSALPTEVAGLLGYDGVMIDNVPAHALGEERMRLLRDWVETLGGGLLLLGGERSLGSGGYVGSALADALPITMRKSDREERRSTALMLVLDRSGSMHGMPMQMCKAAARASAELLQSKDELGVIAFDSNPHWIYPLASPGPAALQAIDSISASGGTDIFSAMQQGATALLSSSAPTRHMLLVTDGHGGGGDYDGLTRQLVAQGITVSTVGVGHGADSALLQRIATTGGGTFYNQVDPSQLRAVFTEDTSKRLGQLIREEAFVPELFEAHPLVEDWPAQVPPLLGYVRSERKATSVVPLVTDHGEPLLAHWRYGLGKVTVFTSAADERWSPLWIAGWPHFNRFWAQVVRESLPPPQGALMDVSLNRHGEALRIQVDVRDGSAGFVHDAQVEAVIHHLDPRAMGLRREDQIPITMRQVAPGRYQGDYHPSEGGMYLVQARAGAQRASASTVFDQQGEIATGTTQTSLLQLVADHGGGSLLTTAAEWQTSHSQPTAITGYRRSDLRPALLLLAILLLFLDLLICRWENLLGLIDSLNPSKRAAG